MLKCLKYLLFLSIYWFLNLYHAQKDNFLYPFILLEKMKQNISKVIQNWSPVKPIETGNLFIDFCFEFSKFPGFVFFLEILTCPDDTQKQTQVNSLLSGRKGTFSGLDLHIVEINKFISLHC